jgi:hypothetical protein
MSFDTSSVLPAAGYSGVLLGQAIRRLEAVRAAAKARATDRHGARLPAAHRQAAAAIFG